MPNGLETPDRFDPVRHRGQLIEAEHLARYSWVAGLAKGRRALDVGSGTGYGTLMLARAGATEAVGLDIEAEAIEASRALGGGAAFILGDARELPFERSSFDLVVCFEVIEHVEDPAAILDELARVVRKNGIVAVSSPNRDVYPPDNPHHLHEFRPDELAAELQKRFEYVQLVRQHDWMASAILADAAFASDGDSPFPAAVRTLIPREPGEELYSLALAGASPIQLPEPNVLLTSVVDAKWWQERLTEQEQRLGQAERAAAKARHRVEELKLEATEAGKRLLEVEQQLASERAVLEAQREQLEQKVAAMEATRVWRLAGRFWALRDKLQRRTR